MDRSTAADLRRTRLPRAPAAGERWAVVLTALGWLAPLALGVWGVLEIVARTPHGGYLTPDSVSYLATAEHVRAGRGFVTFNGNPYTEWPPLFPLVIAAVLGLTGNAHAAATWVNAAAFGALAALAGVWVWRSTRSALAGAAVALVCVRAAALVTASVAVWSEPLYLLFSVAALLAIAEYLRGERRAMLLLAAMLSSAAFLTRYVGVAVIATGVLAVLMRRGTPWRRRVADAALYAMLSIAGNTLWSYRNWLVAGNFSGGRRLAHRSLSHNLRLYGETLGGWVLPPDTTATANLAAGIALAAGFALVALAWIRLQNRRAEGDADPRPSLWPLLVYLGGYSVLVLASATLTPIDALGDRLMLPLLPVALIAAACALHTLLAAVPRRASRWMLGGSALAAVLAWAALCTGAEAEAMRMPAPDAEFALRDWRQSGVAQFLRHTPLRGTVYSNDPWRMYLMTGIGAQVAPALEGGDRITPNAAALQDYEDAQGDGPVWLVWFADDEDGFARTLVALNGRLAMVPVARLADGVVYAVSDQEDPRPPGSCVPAQPGRALCPVRIVRHSPARVTPRHGLKFVAGSTTKPASAGSSRGSGVSATTRL